ncbi:DUF1771-domain-containing protein [Xylaria sp. FL0043]|nr:DUF1771-domain-containing protein [Xylaria sp. FL0043]
MSAGIELERYADRGFGRIGGRDFNHPPSPTVEAQYKQWREEADKEDQKKSDCFQRAHEAYENGDGARAKQLSNEGKKHAAKADELDRKASEMIFRVNNAHTTADTIDLHGQQVHEAIDILTKRIQHDQSNGQTHLHVIVGKGIHSVGHIQKLKPAVEDLCRELGLHYETEENAGRLYVDLQGGHVSHMPPLPPQPASQYAGYGEQPYGGYQQDQYPGQQQHQQQHQNHHPHQQHHGGQSQEEEQYDEIERLVTRLFKKYCCTVM